MVTNINAAGGGLNPTNLTAVGSQLYFDGDDGSHGDQVWESNGATAAMVADIDGTSGALAGNFEAAGGALDFTAYTPATGYQWWTTDGTAAGTTQQTSMTGTFQAPSNVAVIGSNIYFTQNGTSLWKM
jgi:ELWxxDGT repeat protein